jgi:hypothetical protein
MLYVLLMQFHDLLGVYLHQTWSVWNTGESGGIQRQGGASQRRKWEVTYGAGWGVAFSFSFLALPWKNESRLNHSGILFAGQWSKMSWSFATNRKSTREGGGGGVDRPVLCFHPRPPLGLSLPVCRRVQSADGSFFVVFLRIATNIIWL